MSYCQRLTITGLFVFSLFQLGGQPLYAGDYLNSAHGSGSYGVNRPAMTGYTAGNCGHCHEQHASVAGSEPAPVDGGPSAYALFTQNFNTGATDGSYVDSDNLCFNCHSNSASVQPVTNGDYSTTFGGGVNGTPPQYIKEAFSQRSFHNLNDIHTFVDNESSLFPWYNSYSNPCNSCHNPHLAKRNYNDFTVPLASAISKPSDHFNLWGENEFMSAYGNYEAPFANEITKSREPDGSSTTNGSKTPDYVGFCTDCHSSTTSINSSNLGNLIKIDWSSMGDKHGATNMDVAVLLKLPFNSSGNYLLSCLDCHEPHGAQNVMLIRKRVNGSNLPAPITTVSTPNWGYICQKCHYDDKDAYDADLPDARRRLSSKYYSEPYHWQYVHHLDPVDRPFGGSLAGQCSNCHPPGPPSPIACTNCHQHGVNFDILYGNSAGTSRKTF